MIRDIDGNIIASADLAHYGVRGMKWGVRRYQNPDGSLTAKGYQHYLNDIDKQMAKDRRVVAEADEYTNKMDRRRNKGKSISDKQAFKEQVSKRDREAAAKRIEEGRKQCEAYAKKAGKNGYIVSSSTVQRSVANGSDYIKAVTVGLAFGAMGMVSLYSPPTVEGKKYKVR